MNWFQRLLLGDAKLSVTERNLREIDYELRSRVVPLLKGLQAQNVVLIKKLDALTTRVERLERLK